MLVLGRSEGKTVVIDGPCTLTVLKVGKRHVRLGFTAGDDVHIMRLEVMLRDQAKAVAAATETPNDSPQKELATSHGKQTQRAA